jgi:signal transduction histidine kinase
MPIRMRLALLFAVALTVVYSLGAWLLVTRLSAAVLHKTDTQLAAQVSQAAAYLPSDEGGGSRPAAAASLASGGAVVQVIDSSGRVRGTSSEAESEPLLTGRELQRARHARITLTLKVDEVRERLVAAPLAGHPGWIAIAGVSLRSADATLGDVTDGLVIGGVAFILLASAGAYGLARAALSPVERLRREAAAVSERDPASRLQVPRTRDEIAALALTMNDLLARLQAALAQQRAFVADASHELRTPFAVLRGELELAARPGRGREELASAVASTAEEVARLTRITDDLLLLARGDADQLSLQREKSPIRSLLAQSTRHAPRTDSPAVTCTVVAPAGLAALVDPGRIRQAVDNLVDNALRFAPAGTQVIISAWADGCDLVVEVSDSGPGFPAGFLPHAFERFRRPDSGRSRSGGGAGLGLAIVAAIAHAHGGEATARNEPGAGAAVTLRFPGAVIGFVG